EYFVELQEGMSNDSGVNEDYVYRVTLTTGPWLEAAFPPGAQRGTKTRLTFTGWNLGGHAGPGQGQEEVVVSPGAGPALEVSAGVPGGRRADRGPRRRGHGAGSGGPPGGRSGAGCVAAGAHPAGDGERAVQPAGRGLQFPGARGGDVHAEGRSARPGLLRRPG